MPPPKKRRGPGRSFRKVPPKGRKPMRGYAPRPWEPYEYGEGLISDGALEQLVNDINPIDVPRKSYEQAVKSLGSALSARYETGRAIDIEMPAEDIEELPGSQGAGISVNLKDWLDDPAKVLSKTADSWWGSVMNWEDFTSNAEMQHLWHPLINGENGFTGLTLLHEDQATGKRSGVIQQRLSYEGDVNIDTLDPVTHQVTGTATHHIDAIEGTVSNDAYKELGKNIEDWALNQGSRATRVGKFENVQFTLLSIVDAQLQEAEAIGIDWRAAAVADPKYAVRGAKFVDSMDKFRASNLTPTLVIDPSKMEVPTGGKFDINQIQKGALDNTSNISFSPTSTSAGAAMSATGASMAFVPGIPGPKSGNIEVPGLSIAKPARSAVMEAQSNVGIAFTTVVVGGNSKIPLISAREQKLKQTAGSIGAIAGNALVPELTPLISMGLAATDPRIRKYVELNRQLLNKGAKMEADAAKALAALNSVDHTFLESIGIDPAAAVLNANVAHLIHYRETQGLAFDFLEALDGKDFFKSFMWSGRMAATILDRKYPGISNYTKFLKPGDFAQEALKKINYFGLTGVFDVESTNALSRPFAFIAKTLADNRILNKVTNIASFGLIDTRNFAYLKLRKYTPPPVGSLPTVKGVWESDPYKIYASEFSGVLNGIPTIATDSDWKVLSLITKARAAKDLTTDLSVLSAAELSTLFLSADTAAKVAILENLRLNSQLNRVEVAKLFRSFPAFGRPTVIVDAELARVLEHFATNSQNLLPILQKYGIYDPATGAIDPARLTSFLEQIGKNGLNNKYIGIVGSIGRHLDQFQTNLFAWAYKLPGIGKAIKFIRGEWITSAMKDPKASMLLAKAAFTRWGSNLMLRFGISGALKAALKGLGGLILGGIEAISNALPVIGPILSAILAWIGQKIISKIINAIKGPAKAGLNFWYKRTPFHWAYFTEYGFFGSGEDFKVVGCGCCAVGCLLPLLAIMAMGVIGGANFNFKGGSTAGEGASSYILVEMNVSPTTMNKAPGALTAHYNIKVTNKGAADLIGLTIKDDYQIHNGVAFSGCSGGVTNSDGFATWGVTTLAPGAAVSYTCDMLVLMDIDRYVNATTTANGTINGAPAANNASAAIKIGSPVETAPCGWPGVSTSINADCAWHQSSEGLLAEDLAYGTGTTVVALISGTATRHVVTTSQEVKLPYGIYVDIVGTGGYKTRYAHLDPEAGDTAGSGSFPGDLVKTWQVNKGDVVGHTDDTGMSTGPHLHYEIYDATGVNVCPATYLDQSDAACH